MCLGRYFTKRVRFGISVNTLRHWERSHRTPHGPALVLLNMVAKEPKAVLKALSYSMLTSGPSAIQGLPKTLYTM